MYFAPVRRDLRAFGCDAIIRFSSHGSLKVEDIERDGKSDGFVQDAVAWARSDRASASTSVRSFGK